MKRAGLLEKIDTDVWTKGWNVDSRAVGDGRLALNYLAPYVFRVAIGNHRIVEVSDGSDGPRGSKILGQTNWNEPYRPMTVRAENLYGDTCNMSYRGAFKRSVTLASRMLELGQNWEWLGMLVTVTLHLIYVLTVQAKPPRSPPISMQRMRWRHEVCHAHQVHRPRFATGRHTVNQGRLSSALRSFPQSNDE